MANRFALLALLGMLSTVPTDLQAQNTAFTPELLAKLYKLVTIKGADRDVPANFANALGLTASGQSWPSRQEGMESIAKGMMYIVALGKDGNPDLVMIERNPTELFTFRVRRDGTLVAASLMNLQTKALVVRSPAEAQADFNIECVVWSANVDRLIAEDSK